jgi:predicted transport protein
MILYVSFKEKNNFVLFVFHPWSVCLELVFPFANGSNEIVKFGNEK